ncbi:DUF5801 repeats-in-toxin domain-containing protein, partial [Ruegeria lacuscaerulensis]|uniref:DUF5801 repeats-in-toxin domain-containing protein n=1 Tax=Ruegeria lacuscaerulensis TaxID=55218 RepID=UPI001BE4E0AE
MALTINIDGITGIDESLGDQQQDIVGTPAVFPTDVESVFNTALAAYSATVTGYSVAVGDAIEIAGDPTDGTGGNDVQITADPPITGLSLTDDSGFLFDGAFDSGLDSLAGNNINLLSAANDNVVLGIDAVTQEVIFAIYLEEVTDPVSGNIIGGDFWIALFEPIKHPNGSNPDDVVDLANKVFVSAEQVIDFSFEGAPSGQNEFMAFSSGNVTIVASGETNGDSVNSGQGANLGDGSDKTALGTNSQDIGAGEILNFNFTTGFDTEYIVPGLTPTEASDQNNILFTDVFQTTGAAFNVVKVTGGGPTTNPLVHLSAWNTEGAGINLETGTDFISGHSDDDQVNITAVFVNGVDVTGDPTMVQDNGDGTFTVIGAVENDRISIVAPSFNRIAIKNDGDDQVAFSIQAFSLESTSSERAEAGSKLDFYDDGPSQGAQDVNLTVYEDALTGGNLDGTGDVLVATDNLSGIFQSGQDAPGLGFGADSTKDGTTLNSDDGQTFDVEVNKGVNVDVGGTTYNDEVILSISGTDHLRILVNTDGDIRLELLAAVEHGAVTTGNPDDDILGIGLGELFEAFDEDGDKQNFSANDVRGLIEDDAPLFDIELGTGGLQTDDADLAGGPDTDTKGVDELFTVETNSPGADGNGGLVYSLALSAASVTTTLKDTATGNTVYLFDELGDIVGREGTDASNAATGDVVFSVSVNSSTGAVTLTQERAVEHSSADTEAPYNGDTVGLGLGAGDYINLVGTLSDTETPPDQATDAVNIAPAISFTDDGPAFAMELAGQALQTDDAAL